MAIGSESNGQSQTPGDGGAGGGSLKSVSDALSFVNQVKAVFCNQREKYEMFVEVLKDFNARRIDVKGVGARLKALFKGHNNLISGFNCLMPPGYKITPDPEEEEDATREDNKEECSICLRALSGGFIQLECSHRFHANCFMTWWTKYNKTCPYCRLRVDVNGDKN